MHLSILRPTTPHPGYIGGKVGHLPCFDTKTCPICGEFDRLSYVCATNKSTDDQIPHLFLDYWVGRRLGFDRLACPIGGAFELCKIQIPTYSPTFPGWGVVGHNIDRCIITTIRRLNHHVYQLTPTRNRWHWNHSGLWTIPDRCSAALIISNR